MSCEMKRVKLQLKKPNPLFEKWLQEWKEEAAAKGSDLQFCFGKALTSLRKYPLPLNSGRDCGILQNFGNRLCLMLDRRLVEYKKEHPEVAGPSQLLSDVRVGTSNTLNFIETKNNKPQQHALPNKGTADNKKKKPSVNCGKRKAGEYIPSFRSGAYAILLSLFTASKDDKYQGFVEKKELQILAQPLCDSSFTKAENGSYYTAWASMTTLMKKGFVSSAGRGKYTLTAEGQALAEKLQTVSEQEMEEEDAMLTDVAIKLMPNQENYPIPLGSVAGVSVSQPAKVSRKGEQKTTAHGEDTTILSSGSFDVILLVDTQETNGLTSGRKGLDSPLNELPKHNIPFEIRHLKIGDFVWICKDRITGHEVVLPYIIERKRIDDFAQSIMDGRFREQKFRLKQCGIPNLIYLVEKHGKESHTALPLSTLGQAATNTEVTDGFIVKYTGNHKESASYLAIFTNFLRDLFIVKTILTCCKKDLPTFSINDDLISLMSFQEFNSSSMKNKQLSVRDMFIKQLVQLSGLSVEKALAIVEKYPTPNVLYTALKNREDSKLLSDISFGALNRRIGPALSKTVCELYSKRSLS